MTSPFPGMDPFIEDPALWAGFHSKFIVYLCSALARRLPKGYYADVEQHVWVEDSDDDRFVIPDAYIAESPTGGTATMTHVTTEPTVMVMMSLQPRQKYVTIVDHETSKVVTAIELLSPSNKDPYDGRAAYLRKRNDYLAAKVNLVEIDLLRDGDRLPMGKPKLAPFDYCVLVSIAVQYPRVPLWTWTIRDPFPELPVPLKPQHGVIPLSLKPCLDQAYADGRYGDRIDYRGKPAGGLTRSDRSWLEKRLPPKKVAKSKR
jgi:hypothetical protein